MPEFSQREKSGPDTGLPLPQRTVGATLRESMPLPGGVPHPSFIPHDSGNDVNSSAGSPGYDGAPEHYKGKDGIQTFDVWDAYDMDRYLATAFKYFTRHKRKGSEKNDVEKLIHYIDEAVARLPKETGDYIDIQDISLSPDVVVEAFGLEGLMADAARDFLLSFTVRHPRVYLRSAKAQAEEYLFSLD